ncbi:uncharacterized protein LOC115662577 [Syzygium oleosum]|uniref:uncharacterized protein LOC115662577 n=1 Tax=Syzygium oleosum TaxID=219896 RepID=UPI0024B8A1C7|nr:uncharacterized protein LOC115662577 [Syzygium oleosum]
MIVNFNGPWQTLTYVDSAVYGVPSSGVMCRQVLKEYEVYGDAVLGMYGKKPTVRDVAKPFLGLFHSEPGKGLWKRKADAAFQHCNTIKSFFEETLDAIPDSVLDAPIAEVPSRSENPFANACSLLSSFSFRRVP